jgi:hypothetical protein
MSALTDAYLTGFNVGRGVLDYATRNEAGLQAVADAARAGMFPTQVKSVAELDALPVGSVVRGTAGVALKRLEGWMLGTFFLCKQTDELYLYLGGPLDVLFIPSADGSET